MKAHWLEKGGDITAEVLAKNDVFYSRMDAAKERYRAPLDEGDPEERAVVRVTR